MSFKDISGHIRKMTSGKNKTSLIAIIGIIGIVLIAISGLKPSDSADSKNNAVSGAPAAFEDDGDSYKDQVGNELENILSKIDGVGECEVMLSVEGTAEYIFAENVDKSQDLSSNGSSDRYQNEIVMIENSGSRQALVRKIVRPKICGVVVVCRGGGDITIKERVIKAVSAALNIPYGRICVEGKK